MKRNLLTFLSALLFCCNLPAQTAPLPPVGGIVFSRTNGVLPGVTVSLVHPEVGRSSPAVSNMQGVYFFGNVPSHPHPYYIEAYWGNTLIYRGVVSYKGGSIQFNIELP